MKAVTIKRGSTSVDSARHGLAASKKTPHKSLRGESCRIVSESKFWRHTALQQQVLLHAKYKT